ncbi:MAG TPA: hypothetical protein VH142_01015, partial [Polyangiaceae bacterium]|nr:hypothetical protein [Polyangiaceae bacterium]
MAHRDRRTSKKTSGAPLTAALRERVRGAPAATPATKPESVASHIPDANDDDSFRNMLAAELVVVAPLPGTLRVPLSTGTATPRDASRTVRQKRRQVHFVVERDGYGTTAYRSDLGER